MKLYVVVDEALPSGLKMAQGIHAFRAFVDEHTEIEAHWFENSNNIVCLQAPDLPELRLRLLAKGLAVVSFREPDLDDKLTAICVEPRGRRYLSSLPLAA